MSKISSMMDVGRRSMMNSQTALQTVGHNIANKSTEGYSRQRVETDTALPIGVGKLRIGMGAKTTAVTRTNNEHLEKQIANEQSNLGFTRDRAEAMARVEQVFNEQINKGLHNFIGEFFNAVREFANNPESLAARTLVKETADFMSKDFHRVNQQLRQIQGDIDFQLKSHLQEINSYAQEVAQLNERIHNVEVSGTTANDERDRRDLLLKQLGERIDIRYAEGDNGMVTVSAGTAVLLVAGTDAKKLALSATPGNENKREGVGDIVFYNKPDANPVVVTHHFNGGAVGALVDVRDNVIASLNNDIDDLALSIANEVNKAHVQGFDRYNKKGGLFFEIPGDGSNASEMIKVSDDILSDVGKIAAASKPNAPADNTVAHVISNIQNRTVMDNGTVRLGDFYEGIVGRLGVMTRRAATAHESQQDILSQLKNIRESISGVSLDEETAKMIEFQKSFDASARLIKTADELLDTVLSLKRL
jgi:flagellar hook-associated protein 1 FlgK